VAALVGIPVGRWLDRHGPHGVMTAGSVLAVPAVVAVACSPNLVWFLAAWLLVGVAMGAVLYPPAFAPLTAWLSTHLDWRDTYLVLAAILAVITIPGHWFGCGCRGHHARRSSRSTPTSPSRAGWRAAGRSSPSRWC
jgi:MFS family permease